MFILNVFFINPRSVVRVLGLLDLRVVLNIHGVLSVLGVLGVLGVVVCMLSS